MEDNLCFCKMEVGTSLCWSDQFVSSVNPSDSRLIFIRNHFSNTNTASFIGIWVFVILPPSTTHVELKQIYEVQAFILTGLKYFINFLGIFIYSLSIFQGSEIFDWQFVSQMWLSSSFTDANFSKRLCHFKSTMDFLCVMQWWNVKYKEVVWIVRTVCGSAWWAGFSVRTKRSFRRN